METPSCSEMRRTDITRSEGTIDIPVRSGSSLIVDSTHNYAGRTSSNELLHNSLSIESLMPQESINGNGLPVHASAGSTTLVTNNSTPQRNASNLLFNITNVTPLPSSIITPSPSPEEYVIQQRGRRKIPVTFSPDIDEVKNTTKSRMWINRSCESQEGYGITLRSTPRKRLLLSDSEVAPLSPSPKKVKINTDIDTSITTLSDILKIFSADQLISIITKLIQKHPEAENTVKSILPNPDLRTVEDDLNDLRHDIYKAIPRSRFISKSNGSAYARASTNVLAFKKCLIQYGQRFYESKQWSWILEFVIMAWKITRATPIWDNVSHNTARRQCFRALGTYCLEALKNGQFYPNQLKHYENIIKVYLEDSRDLQVSLNYIESCLKPSEQE